MRAFLTARLAAATEDRAVAGREEVSRFFNTDEVADDDEDEEEEDESAAEAAEEEEVGARYEGTRLAGAADEEEEEDAAEAEAEKDWGAVEGRPVIAEAAPSEDEEEDEEEAPLKEKPPLAAWADMAAGAEKHTPALASLLLSSLSSHMLLFTAVPPHSPFSSSSPAETTRERETRMERRRRMRT